MAEAVIKRQDGAMFLFVAFPVVICSLLSGGRISKGAYFVNAPLFFMYICRLGCAREKKALGQRR